MGKLFFSSKSEYQGKRNWQYAAARIRRTRKRQKVFLYTDSACTYQFYEHRGFELAQEKDITLKIGNKEVALRCLLYSKVLG